VVRLQGVLTRELRVLIAERRTASIRRAHSVEVVAPPPGAQGWALGGPPGVSGTAGRTPVTTCGRPPASMLGCDSQRPHPGDIPVGQVGTSVARFERHAGYEGYSPRDNMLGAETGSETTAHAVLCSRSRARAADSPRCSADREVVGHGLCRRADSFFHVNRTAHDLDC
jgi:hypothetical protein